MILLISLLVASNFLVKFVVNYLNLSYMGKSMPKEFAGTWDEQKYRLSQQYLRENTIFDLMTSLIGSGVLIALLLSGAFELLDRYLRSFGFGEVGTGVLFFVILILASSFFSLPFSAYQTFVIEEKYGFNRTTVATFIKDFIVGNILSLIILSLIIGSMLFLFVSYGPSVWIYAFVLFCLYTLFLTYVTPIWILPLFNKFTPIAAGPLKEAIQSYIQKQKFALDEVFSIDGSKRSNKVNAYFTGLGKTKRVALFDTLIANYSIEEIIAILAHEVGHCKKHHVEMGLIIALIGNGLLFYLFSLSALYSSSYYMGVFLFIIGFGAVSWIPSVFMAALSRRNEYEADAFAKETASAKALVAALLKLSSDNLTNLTPHPIKVLFSYSHPPVIDRIRALQS